MAASEDKIHAIDAIEDSGSIKSTKGVLDRSQVVDGKFETVLNEKFPEKGAIPEIADGTKPTLEQLAREQIGVQPVSSNELIAQTEQAAQRIETIKADLETPNLVIKKDMGKLMHSKLVHIDDSLRVALSKAGVEGQDAIAATPSAGGPEANPVNKFFDHLTHAQYQLDHLGTYLESMISAEKELAPANMLAIQIKVNRVQQELEFFTSMLNKALESTKALMNVQV